MNDISPAVFEKLVKNHRQFLRFLERRVGSKAEAEDILQQAFVKGIERADAVRDEESVVAWFYRTLRNAVIDHYRSQGVAARAMDAFAKEIDEAVEPSVEVKDAVCTCLLSLVATLKPEYAEAVQRVDLDGMSVQDYAAEIAIEANNAGVRLHRAREALRKRVVTLCGTCAEHGCLNCTCAQQSITT